MESLVNSGWVKLWREMLSKAIWSSSSPEQKTVLITVLLLANHERNEWMWNGEKYSCEAGQLITSLRSLQEACGDGVSMQNVRTALVKFEKLGFLTNESTKTGRLITIVNWAKYQGEGDKANKASNKEVTKHSQSTNKALTPNKNDKNDKNDKDIIFSPEKEPSGKKKKAEEPKHKYGTYGHVLLTDKQYAKLVAEYGEEWTLDTIQYTDNYCEASGRTYKNYLQAMKNWAFAEVKKKGYKRMPAQQQQSQGTVQYGFDGKPIGGGYQ